jgi:hypothetical protein
VQFPAHSGGQRLLSVGVHCVVETIVALAF